MVRMKSLMAVAAMVALPLLLAGCTPTPYPELDWGTGNHRARVSTVKPKPRPQTAYYDNRVRRACDSYYEECSDVPVPSARPDPEDNFQPQPRRHHEMQAASDPDASFVWPVRGRVITDFGATTGGGRNDGINIVAASGTPIRAAADGTVSYSGNEVRNYGNLMLVRHESGYVTAYAHADHFVVGKGEYVSKGQIIGYVGDTGDVVSPQLHFELRKGLRGEQPVNPRPYLGPLQVAQR
ncbi:MAG: M23 family metallopeptidase [Rhizomicrobium sp.]|nr:M23 family metallopeptidase [Rhizomicrobium sp.]